MLTNCQDADDSRLPQNGEYIPRCKENTGGKAQEYRPKDEDDNEALLPNEVQPAFILQVESFCRGFHFTSLHVLHLCLSEKQSHTPAINRRIERETGEQ